MRRRERSRPTQRRTILAATAVAATALLAACNGPYDFTGPAGADLTYVDGAGAWRVVGADDPIWTGPPIGWTTIPVPGNYDGAGRWEPATYDTTTGTWTTAGGRGTFVFPAPPDPDPGTVAARVIPVPADYDGDGDTDPAYFVEDTATWLIEGGETFVFGRTTADLATPAIYADRQYPFHDIAVPADYDGDGDADPAVYRIETGDVLVRGQGTIRTGISYGQPAPADYTSAPGDEIGVMGTHGEGWAVEGEAAPRTYPATDGAVATPADYDGDGLAELSMVDDNPNTWHIDGRAPVPVGSWNAVPVVPGLQANRLFLEFLGNSCIEEGEFTCPGLDPTVVVGSTGVWIRIGAGSQPVFPGRIGGLPAMGDYDGSGDDEYAVYDPATGQWVTAGGRGTFTFAAPPDIDADPSTSVYPVPHDYDGDGDTDAAFYRDADATWHIDGQATVQFGRATTATPTFAGTPVHDIPVPGDYDGDGDTDLAVYRIDTGQTHIRGGATLDPGWPAGEPATADYDGDGDDDPGLFDPTTGTWHRGTLPAVVPFPAASGLPIAVDVDGDRNDEMTLVTSSTWLVEQRRSGNPPVDPGRTPALGRSEVHANHAFVTAYLAACVAVTPPPGDCT